jgi:hypothetical protein
MRIERACSTVRDKGRWSPLCSIGSKALLVPRLPLHDSTYLDFSDTSKHARKDVDRPAVTHSHGRLAIDTTI